MTVRYARVPGVVVEPLDALWAAFSPASGQTHLLNDESAAILEILGEGAASADGVVAQLAHDSGTDPAAVRLVLAHAWPSLIDGGLVEVVRPG